MKQSFIIRSKADLQKFWRYSQKWSLEKPVKLVVSVYRRRRTTDQNKKLWACLTDLSSQVCWHGHWLTPEEWKDVISAGLKKQRAVPGIDGGFVILGVRTREMDTVEMGEMIDFILWFGAEQNVQWSNEEAA